MINFPQGYSFTLQLKQRRGTLLKLHSAVILMSTTYRYDPVTTAPKRVLCSVSLLFAGPFGTHAVALREGQPVTVGRDDPSLVVLDDRSLSRLHARFSLQDGQVHFEDLGSTNGTFLESGTRVSSGVLAPNENIRLGQVEVTASGASTSTRATEGPSGFVASITRELVRARFFGNPLALVTVQAAPRRDLAALPQMLRPVDMIEPYAPHLAVLLLPEAAEPEVVSLADALHRSDLNVDRIGAAVYPTTIACAEELLAQSLEAARCAGPRQVHFTGPGPRQPASPMPIVHAPAMRRVHALLGRAARTTIPVLILGETGAGKESLAQSVHQLSSRKPHPFRAVNCAALPTSLIPATLFGHERGSFTGADRHNAGLFEQSDKGTLFLDEIGELSLEAQAALLRVLETNRVTRIGSTKELDVDVRVVAATHRDLPAMVAQGRFREDLLYRLDAFTVRVPPLRERPEEILPLAEHFLTLSRSRWSTSAQELSEAVKHALVAYRWPGNVRQLKNVIDRAATVCSGTSLGLDDLPDALFESSNRAAGETSLAIAALDNRARSTLPDRLRQVEADVIRDALSRARGNQSEAARILGLPRRTLANKARNYGLLNKSE